MKRLLVILALALALGGCVQYEQARHAGAREIYIIAERRYVEYDGGETWLVEYTVDGLAQTARFRQYDDIAPFLAHLGRIAIVTDPRGDTP